MMANVTSQTWQDAENQVQEFLDRAINRSRLSVRARIERLSDKAFMIAQCAIAAGIAWGIVSGPIGHHQGMFAPIVAVVCLGMTYGQRLRRVAEVTVGVAIGVFVADIFISFAGPGPWQVAAVAAVSMSIALLLDAGNLLVIQSAVQSIVVATLTATPGQAFSRWIDAVVGGAVALVAATVVPQAPLRRPRVQAAAVVRSLADVLRGAATAARTLDVEKAARVLATARSTDTHIRELQAAADEGMAVIASSPFRRAHRDKVRTVADLVTPLDRAVRDSRVLARRVVVAATKEEELPAAYLSCLEDLASANDLIARLLATNQMAAGARPSLLRVAEDTSRLPRTDSLSAEVVLAQLRSIIVDELQLTGLDIDEARALMPPEPERRAQP